MEVLPPQLYSLMHDSEHDIEINESLFNKKVFLGMVNYGTQSGLLAIALREIGINAQSITHPDRFKRVTDIELLHNGSFFQKIVKQTWNWIRRFFWIFKFDYFHFFYGTTLLPNQLDLPILKFLGKKVVMHYLGNDVQSYKISTEKYKWTNMSGQMKFEDSVKYDEKISRRFNFEKKYCDLQLVCAPMYSEFVEDSHLLPLGIDLEQYKAYDFEERESILIAHAPTDKGFKGSHYIEEAINTLISEGYNIEYKVIESIPHAQLQLEYRNCDIFIDQILAGWYGTASVEAMASGRPVVCFLRESYFTNFPKAAETPIVNANPDNIYQVLKALICLPKQERQQIGLRSRKYVEEVHDIRKICRELAVMYSKI